MTDVDSTAAPLRVLVVDSDERVRDSLAGLLCIGERCVVVGSAGSPAEALELMATSRPDVVIVDPRVPDADAGHGFIDALHQRLPAVRVIVMSWSEGGEQEAIQAGADAFIRKTFRPRELVDAVLAAGRGPLS